jgi:alpha-beta hydrolase superfamily lysophospholipase
MVKVVAIIALVILVLFVVVLAAAPFFMMPMFLGQRYEQEQHVSADFGIESERITLTTDDGLGIAAWRTRAERCNGSVIILSGIQNPSVTAFFGYGKMLADNGWDALLIEMRARSESEGKEIGLGLTEWLDVKAGVDFLLRDTAVKDLPIVAMGTSMGGGTVITAAGELEEIDAVISLSAFSSITDLIVDFMVQAGVPRFLAKADIPFMSGFLGFHYGFDKLKYSPLNGIAKLGTRPILMMHSTEDNQVPFSEFEKLRGVAEKSGVKLTTFIREGNEHFICYDDFFKNPAKDIEFGKAILNFLDVVQG